MFQSLLLHFINKVHCVGDVIVHVQRLIYVFHNPLLSYIFAYNCCFTMFKIMLSFLLMILCNQFLPYDRMLPTPAPCLP